MSHDPSALVPGRLFPDLAWPRLGGGTVAPAREPGWRMLIVYRGRHCPLCKRYLATLDELGEKFAGLGVAVMAVSADPEPKAKADQAEFGWRFPLGYDMPIPDMRRLALHVSDPRTPQQTDRPFAEPGLFLLNPDGIVQTMATSNAPYARPDLAAFLSGLRIVMERNYAPHGLNRSAA